MNEDKKIKELYPDVLEKGGLLSVSRMMFQENLDGIQINGFGAGQNYAHLQFCDRSSQIFLALDERCFLFDFWHAGRKQAAGSSPDLDEVRTVLEQWLTGTCDVSTLIDRFAFIHPHPSRH